MQRRGACAGVHSRYAAVCAEARQVHRCAGASADRRVGPGPKWTELVDRSVNVQRDCRNPQCLTRTLVSVCAFGAGRSGAAHTLVGRVCSARRSGVHRGAAESAGARAQRRTETSVPDRNGLSWSSNVQRECRNLSMSDGSICTLAVCLTF